MHVFSVGSIAAQVLLRSVSLRARDVLALSRSEYKSSGVIRPAWMCCEGSSAGLTPEQTTWGGLYRLRAARRCAAWYVPNP
jgi:hypothetical protein